MKLFNDNLEEFVLEFNNSYFLTYTYSKVPSYLSFNKKDFSFSYETENYISTLNSIYSTFFLEKNFNYYKIKLNSLKYSDKILEFEFSYYFSKKISEEFYDENIDLFLDFLNSSLEYLDKVKFRQYLVSYIKLNDITKDEILKNFRRLEGKVKESIYTNENIFEFLINFYESNYSDKNVHYYFYTIQKEFYTVLVFYLESKDYTFIDLFHSIVYNSFLNPKNLFYYEPLTIIPKNNYLELLRIYQILHINNIYIKKKFMNVDGNILVFIENISNRRYFLKEKIVYLLNNIFTQEEIPFSFIFPEYIKEYHSELYSIFFKNNKKHIQEDFYPSNTIYSDLDYYSYSLNYEPKHNKLFYVPVLYIGNFTNETKKEWKTLEKEWTLYLSNYYKKELLIIPRSIEIYLDRNEYNYNIILTSLELLGIKYSSILEKDGSYLIEEIEINDYHIFLRKKNELLNKINTLINTKVELLKLEYTENLLKLSKMDVIYSYIIKKKLLELNNSFINFLYSNRFIILLGYNLNEFIETFYYIIDTSFEKIKVTECNDKKIRYKIQLDNAIIKNNKCFLLENYIRNLDSKKLNSILLKNHIEILDLIKNRIYVLSNYRLFVHRTSNTFLIKIIDVRKNTEVVLLEIPKDISTIKKIYDLWRKGNLLSDLSYCFNIELGYIPNKLVKMRKPIDPEYYTMIDSEKIKYLNEYFKYF